MIITKQVVNFAIWVKKKSEIFLKGPLKFPETKKNLQPNNFRKVQTQYFLDSIPGICNHVSKSKKDLRRFNPITFILSENSGNTGKVCLRCKGRTLLGVVKNLLKTKSLLTTAQQCFAFTPTENFPQQ